MELVEFTVEDTATVKEAMKQMDRNAHKIIYVVDKANHLKGVLSDGDIRRWILQDGSIQEQVSKVMVQSPVTLLNTDISQANQLMKDNSINSVAVINKKNVLRKIIFTSNEVYYSEKLNLPVVIMAGGKGTRLYPYTKILPKPLIPIGDTPIMERIIDKFNDFGMKHFIISVNYKKNMIRSYFNDIKKNYDVTYIEENKPLGTGGSLCLMKEHLNQTFFVSNCDILVNADLADIAQFHKEKKHDVTIVASIKNTQIPYGVLKLDESGLLESTEEKPEFSYLINTGVYMIEPKLLDLVPVDEYSDLPSIIMDAKGKGMRVGVYPISEDSWLDMGQIKEMEHMIETLGAD
ncbi:MAG TPA: nucleotidyltransferase family protein [Candidatus Jeotgalibaca pullicola]|nr:nucleotidyltransferase family protein [Candidatus Jeotgalibaca pullicola]